MNASEPLGIWNKDVSEGRLTHIAVRARIVCGEKRSKCEVISIVRDVDGSANSNEPECMDEEVGCVCLEFGPIRIRDKIKKALTLDKVVPADFIEYLETRTKSH